MKFQKIILISILIFSFFLLLAGLEITGLIPPYSGSFYTFTVPFLLQVLVCVLLSVYSLIKKNKLIYYSSILLFSSLFLSARYALMHWPGADDGPSLAWFFIIVYGSYITCILGIIAGLITIKELLKEA